MGYGRSERASPAAAWALAIGLAVAVATTAPAAAQDFTIDEASYGNWTIYAYAQDGVFSHCGLETYFPQTGRTLGLQVQSWGYDLVLSDPIWNLPRGPLGNVYVQVGRYGVNVPAEQDGDPTVAYVDLGWDDQFLNAFAGSYTMSVSLPNGQAWSADLTGTARLVDLLDDCIQTYSNYGTGGGGGNLGGGK